MAIRFGMTLAEIIGQLTRGFMKVMGRKPEALEKIKIQQEAVQRFKDMNKVVDMEGRALDPSKTIMGGTQESAALKSGIMKATGAKPKKIKRESLEDFVDDAGGVDPNDPRGIDDFIPDPEDMATGGRVGLKKGMDRRTFMKIMGGLTTLPILGKFAKGAKLVEPVVKKAAEITAPALDRIIEAVMSAGKLVSQSGRRLKELTTKKKLKGIEVEEDMMDGPSYTIKTKDKTIYYRPGRMDEGGLDDDIIEVIEDTVTKKAGGGIARMLGE